MTRRCRFLISSWIAIAEGLVAAACSNPTPSSIPLPQAMERLDVPLRSVAERDEYARRSIKQRDHSHDRAQFVGDNAPRNYDVSSYRVRGSFDWAAATLEATVVIALRVTETRATRLEFDSRVDVKGVTVDDRPATFSVDAAAGLLTVHLDDHCARSERPLPVAITYRASTSMALQISAGRDGDPVNSRVVSTDSEPLRGSRWLPGNHRPSDRAKFAVDMEIDATEDMIANGRRLPDEPTSAGRKRVRYETDFDLPTYVMAFAMGDFVHIDSSQPGETPLSVWYRRGIEVNAGALLEDTRRAMNLYERLLGPYPYSTYSQVLLPDAHYTGEENVSISFLIEDAAQTSIKYDFVAHELAHQWYGDLVTVDTWDDLWIKEGMATLLAKEATRGTEDRVGNRLFGDRFSFFPEDAIRDRSLGSQDDGVDRYTSGPYERAAWLLTQIRAVVGESGFWKALRNVLRARRFGSIGSDDFIAMLTRGMDRALVAKIKASLDTKGTPVLAVTSHAPASSFTWTIDDPAGTLIAPIELTTIDRNGIATVQWLSAGRAVETNIEDGGYLAFDERDVHPLPFDDFGLDPSVFLGPTAPPLIGTSSAARAAFEQRSAAVQELAFGLGVPIASPGEFTTLHSLLDSERGRDLATFGACASLSRAPSAAAREAWIAALLPVVSATPRNASDVPNLAAYASCGIELPTRAFAKEISALRDDVRPGAAARLEYLLRFDYGPRSSFDALSLATIRQGNSTLRDSALRMAVFYANPAVGYSPIPIGDVPAWKAYFSSAMAKSTTGQWLWFAFHGSFYLSDGTTLAMLAQKLKAISMDPGHQRDFVCLASVLAAKFPGAWSSFQADMQPWATFEPTTQEVLADPALCP